MRFLNAGESHGKALSGIIEGMPSNLKIDFSLIDRMLKLRQGGYGRGGRMQIESDKIDILSGIRGTFTTGAPISFLIWNKDWQNWEKIMSPYDDADLESKRVTRARPGHADYAGALKYQQKDIRNVLERASARETATKVAIGAFAMNFLKEFGISVSSYVVGIGEIQCEKGTYEADEKVYEDPVYCPCKSSSEKMVRLIDKAKENGESLGGVVEIKVSGIPVGLGSYVNYDRKLDSMIAGSVMGVQAIKGVEIGLGFESAKRVGSKVHDEIFYNQQKGIYHGSNNAGGIEGGMTNGEEIMVRAAMKPIPTLYNPLQSIDIYSGEAYEAAIERSDVCAVPAAAIVVGSVVAWEVANAFMQKFAGDSLQEIKANYENCQDTICNFPGRPL